MYLENIPNVPGSCISRIEALKAAKPLLTTTEFLKSSGAAATDLIRLATYIETGHDYLDTHVEGKRRPVIKHVTNVTVIAPPTVDPEEVAHFMHHVENGDFAEFIKDMAKEPETADEDDEGEEGPVAPEDDEEPDVEPAPPAPRFGWNL